MMVFNYSKVLWEETEETRVKQKYEASCAQQRVSVMRSVRVRCVNTGVDLPLAATAGEPVDDTHQLFCPVLGNHL